MAHVCVQVNPKRTGRTRSAPVKADDQQVHDRGITGHVVDGQPQITDHRPQGPLVHDDVGGVQVHGQCADGQVGECQTQQVVVVHRLQGLVDLKGNQHQDVPDHRDQRQGACEEDDDDHLEERITSQWWNSGGCILLMCC